MTAPNTGYLVIADISGYTAFLSGSELEHARDSLNTLLGLLQVNSPEVIRIKLESSILFYRRVHQAHYSRW